MENISFILVFGGLATLFLIIYSLGSLIKFFIIKIFGKEKWVWITKNHLKIIGCFIGFIISLYVAYKIYYNIL